MTFPQLARTPLWRLNLALWSAFAALFFVHALVHLDVLAALCLAFFHLAFCLLTTGLLILSYRKLQRRSGFEIRTAAWIIVLSLFATLIQSLAIHILVSLTGWHDPAWSVLELWLARMVLFWLAYMAWSLVYFWLKAEQSVGRQENKLEEARAETHRLELQLLRSQLDPHFLFNALNGVATVVQTDSPPAASMVRELAEYLRYSLDHQYNSVVPLAREIDAMMGYLRIEQARFSEELHIEITTDDSARRRKLPCFLLLPLVENALKHSFRNSEPPWHVSISAISQGETLILEVTNSGHLPEKPSGTSGVGLDILRRRLILHYPDRHRFSLTGGSGIVRAKLELVGYPCFV